MVTTRMSEPMPPAKMVTPTGILSDNHRNDTDGSGGGGEEDGYHASLARIVSRLLDGGIICLSVYRPVAFFRYMSLGKVVGVFEDEYLVAHNHSHQGD